ncbi:Sas10 C-terminal domain-containing protein [Entamoeba marina]
MSSEEVVDDNNNASWGVGKDVYYQTKRNKEMMTNEYIDGDAEEAQRIQKNLLAELKPTDFTADDDFAELLTTAQQQPPKESDEFQLLKLNQEIANQTIDVSGSIEERTQNSKASEASFEKHSGSGLVAKINKLREIIEGGFISNLFVELLCKGDGRDRHPVVDVVESYEERLKTLEKYFNNLENIKAFEEFENSNKMEEVIEDDDEQEVVNEDDNLMELENPENDYGIDDELFSDDLGEFSEENNIQPSKRLVNQPNVDDEDRANWLDNNEFDSEEEKLEEQLLAEMALGKQNQRIGSGEEDAQIKKTYRQNVIKKTTPREPIDEDVDEINDVDDIESKRRIRLNKAEREESKRPVNNVIKYARGFTRGRKNMSSRQRTRKRYEKRAKHIKNPAPHTNALSYKGEKKIDPSVRHSKSLTY